MATKRLTSGQRSELLKRYRGRIEFAKKYRDKEGFDALWRKLIDLYRGKHFNPALLGSSEDRIAVNICFATINVIAPAIAVNYPKLLVWSRKPEEEAQAQIIETVLNYWWRQYKVQGEAALAVKDYLVIGHGWLKVGWRYVEEQAKLDKQELDETAASVDGSDVVAPEDPDEPTANDPESASTSGSPEYEVVCDRPFVERVSVFDVLVDPEAKTLEAANWIAQKIVKPLQEIRQDKRYRQKGRTALKPDGIVNPDWMRSSTDYPEDDVQRCTVYEFYDLQMGTMCVFSSEGDEMLLDPIPQPYVFGHPFVMLRNYDIPDEFYPMGDVEALEPLQMELDKTRSMMMNHRKRFNRKWLYRQDSFDQTGINALNKDIDNTLVPVTESSVPLTDLIVPIPQVPVEPQLYTYENSTLELMDRVSGANEYQQGTAPNIRRTATEASMIQDAADARAKDKLARVELFIAEIAEKVMQLAQQYMTQEQVVRVMGRNGYPIWVPYSREDIQGAYDYEVEAGSTQPKNDQFRRNQALQLLQALTPWVQAGQANAQAVLRYALQYGFEVKNPDEFLMGQAPPQQSEQQKPARQSIIETLNYKDAPPDVQRQMEEAAGFQPSQVGGSSPAEAHVAKTVTQVHGQRAQAAAALANLEHQQATGAAQRQHEAGMQATQQQHEGSQASQEQMVEAALAAQAIEARHALQVENADRSLGLSGE